MIERDGIGHLDNQPVAQEATAPAGGILIGGAELPIGARLIKAASQKGVRPAGSSDIP